MPRSDSAYRMNRARLSAGALLLLSACGSFHIDPVQPLRTTPVSGVTVVYGPEIPEDRRRMLDRLDALGEMQRALTGSFPPGAGPRLHVVITDFRSGRWDATRMHVSAQVLDPHGAVVGVLEADSTSVMGASRGSLIQNVTQDCVNQIANQL
jgi:hypothetical protein